AARARQQRQLELDPHREGGPGRGRVERDGERHEPDLRRSRGRVTPGGAVTIDVGLQPVANGSAQELSRAGWLCFPITQERLINCAPPGYLQRGAADVPLVVYDTNGQIFKGPEDLIRNDAYHGEKCPFEGGGPYHKTPRGYVACHQFPFATAFRAGIKGTAKDAGRGGWTCFPITQERLIHCAPPGYLQ